jgi:hypothetical protein
MNEVVQAVQFVFIFLLIKNYSGALPCCVFMVQKTVVQAAYGDHLVIVVRLPAMKFISAHLRIKVDNHIYFIHN